jgi:hypothetical protein
MPAATPFYAFPYPLGTDLVSGGDDAIKALADRVETIMGKGTSPTVRTWQAMRGTAGAFNSPAWTGMVSVTLTGCPVGATVLLLSSLTLSAAVAGAQVGSRITSTGMTITPAATPLVNQGSANVWSNIAVYGIGVVTVANPVVTAEGLVNTGSGNIDAGCHLVAARIV